MQPVVKQPTSELVNLLKEAQERDGRSWATIAYLSGVPEPTIRGWLTNVSDPRSIALMKVATILKISGNEIAAAIVNREEQLRDLERLQRDRDGLAESSETGSDDPD